MTLFGANGRPLKVNSFGFLPRSYSQEKSPAEITLADAVSFTELRLDEESAEEAEDCG